MKRAVVACLVLVALMAIHGFAGEPAAESKAGPKDKASPKATAETPKPVIPERKLTFDVSEEEQPMAFDVADPKLLEQRYVATFQLVGPGRPRVYAFGPFAPEPINDYSRAVVRHKTLFFGGKPSEAVLKSALDEMPKGRLPSKEVVSLLRMAGSPCLRRSLIRFDAGTEDQKYLSQFTILAPSPERAKELVQGVLSLYDFGGFYPLQRAALAVKGAYQKRLTEQRANLKEAGDALATLEKQLKDLKEFEDITQEALVNFITQQRLISVDMRGVKARINACNKILATGMSRRLAPSRVEQLETLKIAAEIELVGLAARKEALEDIVKKGRERKEVSAKRVQALNRVGALEREVSRILEGITHYEAELKKCAPYPVQDGKVVIRRIKWVPPEQMGREKSD